MIYSNLSLISHRLATKHSRRTDGQTDRQTDDDDHANSSIVTKVYDWLKTMRKQFAP